MTLLNFGVILWAAIDRGKTAYIMGSGNQVSEQLKKLMLVLYMVIDGLLLISAIFLADALRRLKSQFKNNQQAQLNSRTMCLHVTALFSQTGAHIVASVLTMVSFVNPAVKIAEAL